ncbi:MAG: 50S ribosomal protein L21e [Candidatus Pacearchaeota archaeon]
MMKKKVRTRGKISFSKYFQDFENGDRVSVVIEPSMRNGLPERMQGRTGIIESKRGRAYIVKINDQKKEKTYLIQPINLKKIKHTNKDDKQ